VATVGVIQRHTGVIQRHTGVIQRHTGVIQRHTGVIQRRRDAAGRRAAPCDPCPSLSGAGVPDGSGLHASEVSRGLWLGLLSPVACRLSPVARGSSWCRGDEDTPCAPVHPSASAGVPVLPRR